MSNKLIVTDGTSISGGPDWARVLTDLHDEFVKASANLDREYSGPAKTAEARVVLIETYSQSVERVVRTMHDIPTPKVATGFQHEHRDNSSTVETRWTPDLGFQPNEGVQS